MQVQDKVVLPDPEAGDALYVLECEEDEFLPPLSALLLLQ
jgi:hypothetical protein